MAPAEFARCRLIGESPFGFAIDFGSRESAALGGWHRVSKSLGIILSGAI